MKRCPYCGHDTGIYPKMGKGYQFKCLYCGIEVNGDKTKIARAVLQVMHGDGTNEYIVYRENPDKKEITDTIRLYRFAIQAAELREINGENIKVYPILKEKGIRPYIAKFVCSYEWLVNFIGRMVEWRLDGQKKRKAAKKKKGSADKADTGDKTGS